MQRFFLLSLVLMILPEFISAQTAADSGKVSFPVLSLTDSVSKRPRQNISWQINPGLPLSIQLLQRHPYFNFGTKAVVTHSGFKEFRGKELIFYVLIVLLLLFAFLKQAFSKYFNDLFRLFFRNTPKQRQIREQLIQTPLPSLIFNVFFVVSTGLYIDILFFHFNRALVDNFWLLYLYCCVGLTIIYIVKFAGLKITGWLFNMKEAADAYIFVVFIINKVIGIFLVPFLVLLSFMEGAAYEVAIVLSWCGIGILLIYRFLLTYASVRKLVRFNLFHFLLYLCAFEIAPLLLIYKALLFVFL